jgi:hypothetical protein
LRNEIAPQKNVSKKNSFCSASLDRDSQDSRSKEILPGEKSSPIAFFNSAQSPFWVRITERKITAKITAKGYFLIR